MFDLGLRWLRRNGEEESELGIQTYLPLIIGQT
jgi:hypothetical protein